MKSCCKKAVNSFWNDLSNELDDINSWENYGSIVDIICKHTEDEIPQWRKDEIKQVRR